MIAPETWPPPVEMGPAVRPNHTVVRGQCRACGRTGARLYACGWRCPACMPAAAGGRPESPSRRCGLSLVKEPTHG